LERLKSIDASLEEKLLIAMSIKDKTEKKALMGLIQECKTRSSQVIKELKDLTDLSNISNEVVARLLDVGYKGLAKSHGHLNRMLDKLILGTAELYQ